MTSSDEEQIIYALVSRGGDVLAEYTDRTGNFEQVTRQLLNKIPNENKIMSYVYPKENYVFHYIVEDGITYLCMADEGFGRTVPFRYLEDMKNKFQVSFGDRAKTAHAFAFNADFQNEQANDPRNKTYRSTDSKIYEINEEIENTKNTVMESIEKVLDRGETLELLVHKSDTLNQSALKFNKHSKQLKNRMLCKNIKMTLALVFIIIVMCMICVCIYVHYCFCCVIDRALFHFGHDLWV